MHVSRQKLNTLVASYVSYDNWDTQWNQGKGFRECFVNQSETSFIRYGPRTRRVGYLARSDNNRNNRVPFFAVIRTIGINFHVTGFCFSSFDWNSVTTDIGIRCYVERLNWIFLDTVTCAVFEWRQKHITIWMRRSSVNRTRVSFYYYYSIFQNK